MDKYIFPAIFEIGEKNVYCITFPDLPGCITQGDTLEDAYNMAKEALSLHLYGMEEDNDFIPKPTDPNKINLPEGAFIAIIEVWMPLIRNQIDNKVDKKNVTLPHWLNKAAEKSKINFSQVLQKALKYELGICKHEND